MKGIDTDDIRRKGAPRAERGAFGIGPAKKEDLPFVRKLLDLCGLPPAGVGGERPRFFIARRGPKRIGCVGIEAYGEHVLLRSLAVLREERNAGAGAALLSRAIGEARAAGGRTAWGLTTFGRKGLFETFGFRVVPRPEAPPELSRSSQLRGLCPESAVLIALPLRERSCPLPRVSAQGPRRPARPRGATRGRSR